VTGVGLGPDECSGALGVSRVLGDREGLGVAGAASVELRSSVVTAGVTSPWALTEAQQPRSTSRKGGKPRGPMARQSLRTAGAGIGGKTKHTHTQKKKKTKKKKPRGARQQG
jgi:hypothetical protein